MNIIICRDYEDTQSHECIEKNVIMIEVIKFFFIIFSFLSIIFASSFIYNRIKAERTDLRELRKIYKEVNFPLNED